MAITVVGTPQSGVNNNGGNVTLTFDGTPAQNDVVILLGGHSSNGTSNVSGPVTSGYTQISKNLITAHSYGAWYKVLGASPDASVTGNGNGAGQDSTAYSSLVLRGVDTSNVLDAAAVATAETTSTDPDPAAITLVTTGSAVMTLLIGAYATYGWATPSGFTSCGIMQGIDTRRIWGEAAYLLNQSSGSYDPPPYVWGTSVTWACLTVAIRPAGSGSALLPFLLAHFSQGIM